MIDGARHSFMKLADDKLYYDEKRKRFVNTADIPGHAHRAYYNGHFKHVSPALTPALIYSDGVVAMMLLCSSV